MQERAFDLDVKHCFAINNKCPKGWQLIDKPPLLATFVRTIELSSVRSLARQQETRKLAARAAKQVVHQRFVRYRAASLRAASAPPARETDGCLKLVLYLGW